MAGTRSLLALVSLVGCIVYPRVQEVEEDDEGGDPEETSCPIRGELVRHCDMMLRDEGWVVRVARKEVVSQEEVMRRAHTEV